MKLPKNVKITQKYFNEPVIADRSTHQENMYHGKYDRNDPDLYMYDRRNNHRGSPENDNTYDDCGNRQVYNYQTQAYEQPTCMNEVKNSPVYDACGNLVADPYQAERPAENRPACTQETIFRVGKF